MSEKKAWKEDDDGEVEQASTSAGTPDAKDGLEKDSGLKANGESEDPPRSLNEKDPETPAAPTGPPPPPNG